MPPTTPQTHCATCAPGHEEVHHRHHRHAPTPAEKQLIEKRLLARYGEHRDVLLADTQPKPDSSQISLPLTLRIRPTWRTFAAINFFVIGGVCCSVLSTAFFDMFKSGYHPGNLEDFIIVIGIFVAISGLVMLILRSSLNITEEGIERRLALQRQFLAWRDITLFAMEPGSPYDYSISSEDMIIHIIRPNPSAAHWYSVGEQPSIPHAEYIRQLDGVIGLIAARTHLPLYDLRKTYPYKEGPERAI